MVSRFAEHKHFNKFHYAFRLYPTVENKIATGSDLFQFGNSIRDTKSDERTIELILVSYFSYTASFFTDALKGIQF